ncbi:MAG: DUF2793 domain-containing protein [Erythrobacter sp.]
MTDPITFPSSTSHFELPLLFAGQAQKEFFVNEALTKVDAILQKTVLGSQSAPPSDPATGNVFRIIANATGEWAGHEGMLALFIGGAWTYIEPTPGLLIFDQSAEKLLLFADGWKEGSAPANPQSGSVVDIEARAAIDTLIQTLRNIGIFS